MRTYITLFILSTILALLITPFVGRRAIKWGAIAVPDDGRHIHKDPTPRLGGISIFVSFILTMLCVPFLGNLVSDTFQANLSMMIAVFVPATLMLLFGVYDDFRGSSAPLKIIFQTISAIIVFASGFRIENISSPFGGSWELPVIISFPLTAGWIIWITNAFNLIDGIDGLAAGASVFALLSILVFSIAQGNPEISLLSVVLVGAVIGFLRYNFNPATIFLGDSGSLFLGFMVAVLSLIGSQKGSTIVAISIPLVSFGLPIAEVGLSVSRRFLSGAPLLTGDRGHIHHRLLERGLNQRQVVILLYAVCALFTLFGLMLLNPQRNLAALIFFVLGAGIIIGVQHLRYAEFSELGNQIRRGVTARRRALAVNVRFRRTSDDLGSVETPDQLFKALERMLSTNEFDCAVLKLNEFHPVFEYNTMKYGDFSDFSRDGFVVWVWHRGDTDLDEIFSSDQFWSFRLPVNDEDGMGIGSMTFYRCLLDSAPAIDLGHLCSSVQIQLSGALSRLTKKQYEELHDH